MPRILPRLLRLPLHAAQTNDGLLLQITRTLRPAPSNLLSTFHVYAFKNDERDFARLLLRRQTRLWLWRSHQGAACGDFVILDLSAPDPLRRCAFLIELKQDRPLRVSDGPSGFQMRNAPDGLSELQARGLIAPGAPVRALIGDAREVLGYFEAH